MKMRNFVLKKSKEKKEPRQCERTFANPVVRNGVSYIQNIQKLL